MTVEPHEIVGDGYRLRLLADGAVQVYDDQRMLGQIDVETVRTLVHADDYRRAELAALEPDPHAPREMVRFPLPADWADVERMVNAVYHDAPDGDSWLGYAAVAGEVKMTIDGTYLVLTWHPQRPAS